MDRSNVCSTMTQNSARRGSNTGMHKITACGGIRFNSGRSGGDASSGGNEDMGQTNSD